MIAPQADHPSYCPNWGLAA